MLEFSKRRRMQIMQQISDSNDRLSSAERRKKAENSYNQFLKTMSNFNTPHIRNSNNSANKTTDFQQFRKQSQASQSSNIVNAVLNTPTVKDIMPQHLQQASLNKQFYQLEQRQQFNDKSETVLKQNKLKIVDQHPTGQQQPIPEPINLNQLTEQRSERNSEPPVQDQQIKFPDHIVGSSAQTESNNNSEAIFFTSQFKDYIAKQSPHKQRVDQQLQAIQQPKQLASPQKQQPTKQVNFEKNQSVPSIRESNQSSLKYSLNESAVHQLITKKLTNELVIDSIGNPHQVHLLKRLSMTLCFKSNIRDLIIFSKQIKLNRLIHKNNKLRVLDNLLINKELVFQVKKGDIKANSFFKQTQSNLIKKIFNSWQFYVFQRNSKIKDFINRQSLSVLDKVFRSFKMLLYDRRINHQIDTYYLSKIFFAFKTTVQIQTKKLTQRAYKFYFKNLKRRMFFCLIEGTQNIRRERQINDLARDQYYFSLVRKVFEAWKEGRLREQKVIRLSMTTKNILKQTNDHRLFQTKTFDFHEVK